MTDLHSHILYGVDDGSESLEMSMDMLDMASRTGTRNLVLTPHCNVPGGYTNYMNPTITGRYEKIKKEAERLNIDINIYLGMEVHASDDIDYLIRAGEVATINKSRYLLVEFPFEGDPMWVSHILYKIQSTGLTPVMAHPERYEYVQEFPFMVYDWVRSGCLMQVNRGSIVGRFGAEAEDAVHFILENGLAHFAGSDGHKPYVRQPILIDAYEFVKECYGSRAADRIFKINPVRLLNNQRLSSGRSDNF